MKIDQLKILIPRTLEAFSHVSESSKQALYNIYRLDFELFGYNAEKYFLWQGKYFKWFGRNPCESPRLVEPAWLWESQSRMATPLGLEKFGRIDFSLARWGTEGKKTPKSVRKHANWAVGLVRIFFIHFCVPVSHFSKGHPSTCWKKY